MLQANLQSGRIGQSRVKATGKATGYADRWLEWS